MEKILNIKTEKLVRPPIVVVMGHIDHGKSMILETIRNIKMLEKESGGITQHIGAYEIMHKGKKITFIDTPGHEAFSKIRSRGAKVADLAILVVAADEGVKPQTREALEIIKENNLPFIVALNKIDKEEANPERVKQELAKEEVLVEGYGGQIPVVEVSARTGKNVDELLETILLLAELENVEAHPDAHAEGVVIEAHLDPRRGIMATLLIRDGTLRKKDILVIGRALETIKIFEDFQGNALEEAGPSSPVRITGLSQMPVVGDRFGARATKEEAMGFIKTIPILKAEEKVSLVDTGAAKPIFNVIVKSDVAGSGEALGEALKRLESDMIGINIIWNGIGDISESDVKRALATRMVTIVGFKVRMDPVVRELAEKSNIRIVTGDVIYDLLDKVKRTAEDFIPPEIRRNELGKTRILKVFKREGVKQVVGGRVEEGRIIKGTRVDIRRGKEVIGTGTLLQLQREKTPVEEAGAGTECGMMIEMKAAIEQGDVAEAFEEEVMKKVL